GRPGSRSLSPWWPDAPPGGTSRGDSCPSRGLDGALTLACERLGDHHARSLGCPGASPGLVMLQPGEPGSLRRAWWGVIVVVRSVRSEGTFVPVPPDQSSAVPRS